MRKTICIIALFVLAIFAWAGGAGEKQETIKLLLVNTGNTPWPEGWEKEGGYNSFQEKIIGDFMQKNPNIQVTMIARDVTQGSLTVDALMAKGTPPDVWLDAAGYFRKYLNADYALPLEKYMDVNAYQKHLVDVYTRDGHVYALPMSNVATGMAINLDMLKKIGYVLPAQKDWTTEEFVRLSEKLKAAKTPSTMVMTQQGLISWNLVWLYAFGAELYRNQDYSKVTINTPEAQAGLEYMKMLVDKGYAWPYPNEVNDDMGVDLFTTGKVFSCMLQNGHTDYWIPEQIKNGTLEKEFEMTFIEFPHAPGRAHTPVYGYQAAVIAHRSDNEARNLAVIELFKTQVGPEYQYYVCTTQGGFPTLKDFEIPNKGTSAKPSYKAIAALAPTAGLMDLGGLALRASEVNAAWKIPVQEFMDGKITAREVLDRFEDEAKKILAMK